MIERERWVIYPLLFFALLLAARDSLIPPEPLQCGVLECNELRVTTQDGRNLVRLGGSLDSGVVIVYGPAPSMGPATLDSPVNEHLLELGTAKGGGYLTAYGPHNVPTLKLGHHEPLGLSGLIAVEGSDQPQGADSPTDDSLWGSTLQWPTVKLAGDSQADEHAEPDVESVSDDVEKMDVSP